MQNCFHFSTYLPHTYTNSILINIRLALLTNFIKQNKTKKSVGYFGTIPKNHLKSLTFVLEVVREFYEIFVPLLYLNKIKEP